MSGQLQRGKIKTSRSRNLRSVVSHTNKSYINQNCFEDLGIFANSELTYMLGRLVIGNIGKILTTENQYMFGVIKAISPSADFGLSCAQVMNKNDKTNVTDQVVPWNNVKMIVIPSVKLSDYLSSDIKTDFEISWTSDVNNTVKSKELVPFFVSSEGIKDFDFNECSDGLDKDVFPAKEMFETNAKLFSIGSTFNEDLREYTTPVDKSDPNYPELEAKCAKLAKEMENHSLVDDDSDLKNDNEEEQFSAVSRATSERIQVARTNHRSGFQKSNVYANNETQVLRVSAQSTISNSLENSNFVPKISSDSGLSVSISDPGVSLSVSTITNSTVETKASEKLKKSNLDPNAPEFQPMGLAYIPIQMSTSAPSQHPTMNSVSQTVNSFHYASVVITDSFSSSPASLINQTHLCSPSYAYTHQNGQFHQFMPPISVCVSGSIPQNFRGSSLPPVMNQNYPVSVANHGLTFLPHQHGTYSQVITAAQPVMLAGHTPGRLSTCIPPSSMNMNRQRLSDSTLAVSHTPTYPVQQSMSIPAFQPPFYQFNPSNPAFPFILSGHPPVGLQFLPAGLQNAGNASNLMVGNVNTSHSANQLYPGHAIMQMQAVAQGHLVQSDQLPTPSTTPQQTNVQYQHQVYSPIYHDNPHPVHLSSFSANYPPNFMFVSQQGAAAPSFYPTIAASTALGGPNAPVMTAAVAGSIPVLGQQSYQHPLNTGMHHPNHLESTHFVNNGHQQSHALPLSISNQHTLFQQQVAAIAQAQLLHAQHGSNSHYPGVNNYHTFVATMPNANSAVNTASHGH